MKDIVPAIPLPKEYKLNPAFCDDFSGPGLDRTRWMDFYADWKGRPGGFFYDPANVAVKDGMLRITAREVPEETLTDELRVLNFPARSCGIIRTRERVLYGCFQTRFRTMNAAVCNAFWLNDSLDVDKKYKTGYFSDEIDIYEVFGKSTIEGAGNIFFNTAHRLNTPYIEGRIYCGNTSFAPKKQHKPRFAFHKGFHTATFLWTPDTLEWYLDGKLTFRHPNDYYHSAMRINFDCEVITHWAGSPDSADLPAEYQVDYLRVWQK